LKKKIDDSEIIKSEPHYIKDSGCALPTVMLVLIVVSMFLTI